MSALARGVGFATNLSFHSIQTQCKMCFEILFCTKSSFLYSIITVDLFVGIGALLTPGRYSPIKVKGVLVGKFRERP